MKNFFASLLFASLLFALCVLMIVDVMVEPFLHAQSGVVLPYHMSKPIPDFAKVKFVLVTSSNVKCYDCGMVYAVACAPQAPDCGVPNKLVIDSDYFETADAAIKFLEDNQNKDFVKLFSLTGVVVNLTEVKETIKQPDQEITKKHYAVSK